MNTKCLSTLEYNKIIDMLVDKADSTPGKELCNKTTPLDNIEEIEVLLQQTNDALTRIYAHGAPSFKGIFDINASF